MLKKKKHVDLLLIGEEGKRYYVLIKSFNPFMRDHTLDYGKRDFLPLLFTNFYNRRNIETLY